MVLQKLEKDVSVISKLDDKPTLSSSELKKKFDEGPQVIKDYINNVLLPALENINVKVINDLTTGGSNNAASAEMVKKLNTEKQNIISYGSQVPVLSEGQIFIEIIE